MNTDYDPTAMHKKLLRIAAIYFGHINMYTNNIKGPLM